MDKISEQEDEPTYIFIEYFEQPLLETTRAFYSGEADRLIGAGMNTEYLDYVSK